ncbi:hypothetical protein QUB60_02055 [Microcoleus sp. A2-C5]|uniref:hypothetical protein n=1 Tax=unclassified Microcoleus TaxID=2642155 RepID=UPI002FD1A59B|nr:hypothetical protein [Lyngbya sp. CCAP 1446/10]
MSGYILDCPDLKYLNILNSISQQRQLSGDRPIRGLANSQTLYQQGLEQPANPGSLVAQLKVGVDGSKPNSPVQASSLVLVVFKSVSSVYS